MPVGKTFSIIPNPITGTYILTQNDCHSIYIYEINESLMPLKSNKYNLYTSVQVVSSCSLVRHPATVIWE